MVKANFLLGGDTRDLDLQYEVMDITVLLIQNSGWVLKYGEILWKCLASGNFGSIILALNELMTDKCSFISVWGRKVIEKGDRYQGRHKTTQISSYFRMKMVVSVTHSVTW